MKIVAGLALCFVVCIQPAIAENERMQSCFPWHRKRARGYWGMLSARDASVKRLSTWVCRNLGSPRTRVFGAFGAKMAERLLYRRIPTELAVSWNARS